MTPIHVLEAGRISPEEEIRLVRLLMEKTAKEGDRAPSRFCVASLIGKGLSLGMFQIPTAAVKMARCRESGFTLTRRLTGGTATYYGEGILSLSLILPGPSSFSDPIPPAKVINRYIRGILSGLISLGVNALYYGGDFLTVNQKRAGYLSMEVDSRGVVLYQTLLAMDKPYPIPEDLSNYPLNTQRRPDPPATTLALELNRTLPEKELIQAIGQGYHKRFGIAWEGCPLTPEESHRMGHPGEEPEGPFRDKPDPASEGLVGSSLYEFPVGFIQAWVAPGRKGPLEHVRITGDLVGNSPAIHKLEDRLACVPPIREDVEPLVNRTYGDPSNFLLGLRSPRIITDAVLNAAGRAGRETDTGAKDTTDDTDP